LNVKVVIENQLKKETCFNTLTKDVVKLQNCRYGHLSFIGLNILQQNRMVRGFPYIENSYV